MPAPDPAEPVRFVVSGDHRFALWIANFGLACCAVEFVAATLGRPGSPAPEGPADPVDVNVLVVSGTLTDKMAPALLHTYERLPEPRFVLSFGACANCGGPYWDSYSVTKGVDQLIPVDVYVPGCPPRPEALLAGLRELKDRVEASLAGPA